LLNRTKSDQIGVNRTKSEKLKSLGISGKLLDWITNFLHLRKMRVRVEVLSGVPQGSVLGPLLLLLFVNDLPDWISSNIQIFEDNTKIWCIIKEIDDGLMLQSDLDNLVKWSDKWLLNVVVVASCDVYADRFPSLQIFLMEQTL